MRCSREEKRHARDSAFYMLSRDERDNRPRHACRASALQQQTLSPVSQPPSSCRRDIAGYAAAQMAQRAKKMRKMRVRTVLLINDTAFDGACAPGPISLPAHIVTSPSVRKPLTSHAVVAAHV